MNEGTNIKNIILAMVISVAFFMVWNKIFPPPELPKKSTEKTVSSNLNKNEKKSDIVKEEKKKEDQNIKNIKNIKNSDINYQVKEETTFLETSKFKAIFSTYGASIKFYSLKGKKFTTDKEKTKNIILIDEKDNNFLPYSMALKSGKDLLYASNLPFKIESKDDQKIIFAFSDDKFKITKTYTISKTDYTLHLYIKIENLTSSEQIFSTSMKFSSIYDKNVERKSPFGMSGKTPVYKSIDDSFERIDNDDFEKTTIKKLQFIGVDDQYFASFIKLNKQDLYNVTPTKLEFKKENIDKVRLSLDSEPLKVSANGKIEFSYELFNGPKLTHILKEIGAEDIIDYGFVAVVAKLIHWLILFLFSFIGNYGFALIVLTILVKVMLYPLTKSSYVSMHKMKKLKPQLDKLKEKYGKDREKIGRETMALYKKEGVSPLGGCLPMLLQMPIWFGLYRAIQYSVELYNEPFFLWIQDLSMKDPYYILPITMGILMFFQQKLSSASMDQMQAKIMLYTMPIMFSVFMIMLPSGLVLYIWTNTLISILQQKYINNKLDKEESSGMKGKKAKASKV